MGLCPMGLGTVGSGPRAPLYVGPLGFDMWCRDPIYPVGGSPWLVWCGVLCRNMQDIPKLLKDYDKFWEVEDPEDNPYKSKYEAQPQPQ